MIPKTLSAVIIILFLVSGANAAQLVMSSSNWVHVSEEQPIDEFLREFFASQNILVSLDKSISGETVSGRFNEKPQQIFDKITAAFKLIWYYDGYILYISRADEAVTKIINLDNLSTQRLKSMLEDMDVPDPRYPLKFYPKEKIVYVTGHKRYIELIQEAVAVLDGRSAVTKKNKEVFYQTNSRVKMVANKAYVRSGPSKKNAVMGTITSKAPLNVLGRHKDWLFIHYTVADVYGWVQAIATSAPPTVTFD